MSGRFSDDYKHTTKMLFVLTVFGVINSILFKSYGDDEEGVGPCFLFIYVIFAIVVIDWIVHKIKNLFSRKSNV